MFLRTFESFTYLAFLLHFYFLEIIHFDLINSFRSCLDCFNPAGGDTINLTHWPPCFHVMFQFSFNGIGGKLEIQAALSWFPFIPHICVCRIHSSNTMAFVCLIDKSIKTLC